MNWVAAFWQGIDWQAAALALATMYGCATPWLLLRNLELPNMLARLTHEEKEWLVAHPASFDGHFRRHESLPSYGRILLSLWVPLKEFEDAVKPVAEYYAENNKETN